MIDKTDWRLTRHRRARDGQDGQDAIPVDLDGIRSAIADLKRRVSDLEGLPTLPQAANDPNAVPRGIGDLRRDIDDIRVELTEIRDGGVSVSIAEPAELKAELKTVADSNAELSQAVLRAFSEQQSEIEALKGTVRRLDILLSTFFADIERANQGG